MMNVGMTAIEKHAWAIVAVAAAACLTACHTSSVPVDGHADGVMVEASSPEAGFDGAATTCPTETVGTVHAAPCPSMCPAAASACTTNGARCEYGDDPRGPTCRATAICRNGVWSTIGPSVPVCPALTPAADCPSSSATATGQTCGAERSWCPLPSEGSACVCTTCTWNGGALFEPCPTGTPRWQCAAPLTFLDARCPAVLPTLGTTCTTNVSCRYVCGPGGLRSCQGGVWIGADGGFCPV
jgi:hypothetical protein